jgi:hypothetical protein
MHEIVYLEALSTALLYFLFQRREMTIQTLTSLSILVGDRAVTCV